MQLTEKDWKMVKGKANGISMSGFREVKLSKQGLEREVN